MQGGRSVFAIFDVQVIFSVCTADIEPESDISVILVEETERIMLGEFGDVARLALNDVLKLHTSLKGLDRKYLLGVLIGNYLKINTVWNYVFDGRKLLAEWLR